MTLEELRSKVEAIEDQLEQRVFVPCHVFERDGRFLELCLTARLRRKARTKKVWKSKALLTALKNASYGFDEERARSRGGADGLFLLDRTFRPANEMMRKIFDGYLDKPGSGADEVAAELGVSRDELLAVRLVSHHLRLLGPLHHAADRDCLVLVDFDDTE